MYFDGFVFTVLDQIIRCEGLLQSLLAIVDVGLCLTLISVSCLVALACFRKKLLNV